MRQVSPQALERSRIAEECLAYDHCDICIVVTEGVSLPSVVQTLIADSRADILTLAPETMICGVGTVWTSSEDQIDYTRFVQLTNRTFQTKP